MERVGGSDPGGRLLHHNDRGDKSRLHISLGRDRLRRERLASRGLGGALSEGNFIGRVPPPKATAATPTPAVPAAASAVETAAAETRQTDVAVLLNGLLDENMELASVQQPTSAALVHCDAIQQSSPEVAKPEVVTAAGEETAQPNRVSEKVVEDVGVANF